MSKVDTTIFQLRTEVTELIEINNNLEEKAADLERFSTIGDPNMFNSILLDSSDENRKEDANEEQHIFYNTRETEAQIGWSGIALGYQFNLQSDLSVHTIFLKSTATSHQCWINGNLTSLSSEESKDGGWRKLKLGHPKILKRGKNTVAVSSKKKGTYFYVENASSEASARCRNDCTSGTKHALLLKITGTKP